MLSPGIRPQICARTGRSTIGPWNLQLRKAERSPSLAELWLRPMARAAPCTRPERTPRARSSITWRSSIRLDKSERSQVRSRRSEKAKSSCRRIVFAKPAICPCRFFKPEYVCGPLISGPDVVGVVLLRLEASRFWSGLMTRVGFCFVPGGGCRSLTVWFWIRARLDLSAFVTAIAGLRRDEIRSGFQNAISQRILNCALSVDFLWKKD